MIHEAKGSTSSVQIDLHPARPDYQGMMMKQQPLSLEADPTFAELEAAGATVVLNNESHTVLQKAFVVSGETPRTTSYEQGVPSGIKYSAADKRWEEDTLIKDERFVMCCLEGK